MENAASAAHWRRTLGAMLALQCVAGAAFSIVPPVLPLALLNFGVTADASLRAWSGLLIGVTPLAAALTSPAWGYLVHRIDPRLVVLTCCTCAAICTASMSFATNPWQLLALRFTMGLFGGHIVAGMSIVSLTAPSHRLGWSLGWMATAQLSGTLVGPLLGGALADHFHSLQAPFLVGGTFTLLVCGVLKLVPRLPAANHGATRQADVGMLARFRSLATLALVMALAQGAIMGPQSIITLRVHEMLGTDARVATMSGLAFSVVAFSGLVAAPWIGRLSDVVGSRRMLLAVLVCAAIGTAAQGYAGSYGAFVTTRFCAGLFLCSVIPVVNSLVGRSVPPAERGQAYGLTTGAAFLGGFLGPVSCGLLAAQWGLTSVFLACGALLIVSFLLVYSRGALGGQPVSTIAEGSGKNGY
jgi:DHA1 family multidrug resistance protein-like MFS transporter